ncbi:MAG: DUF2269 family protein [Dehalococcoidia bacterium]
MLYDTLLIGHILGVLVMAFGTGTGMLTALAAGSQPDVATVARTARLESLGGRVTTIATVVVLLLGVWLVIEGDSWEFSQAWISSAFVLWFIAMGIGGGIMARHARRLGESADAAAQRGETTSATLIEEFNAPLAKIGGVALLLLYVAFIVLMVAKPGA